MKTFNGKAIYNPSGKAGEYSYWACNFYVGCSNGCTYCYCKKGILAGAMGQDKPQLKKCFLGSEEYALFCFESEVNKNLVELQKHGLFFSFTTDPMILETKSLTIAAVKICNKLNVPVSVLTKEAGYVYLLGFSSEIEMNKKLISVGFTLTGHDELEPNASTNEQRIRAMELCKQSGYNTFASLEPIINFADTLEMIEKTQGVCDLYKIGLESGKSYPKKMLAEFIEQCCLKSARMSKIYFKDSILKQAGISRDSLPEYCVNRDYHLHGSFYNEP